MQGMYDTAIEELVASAVELVAQWRSMNKGALHCGQTASQRATAERELDLVADHVDAIAIALARMEGEEA